MTAISITMVGLSLTSTCCLAGTANRRSVPAWISSLAMLTAMTFMCLPSASQIAVLISAAALVATVPLSLRRPVRAVSATPMQLHRALSALGMALLIILGMVSTAAYSNSASAVPSPHDMTAMHMTTTHATSLVSGLVVGIVICHVALSTYVLAHAMKTETARAARWAAAETTTMAALTILMALPL